MLNAANIILEIAGILLGIIKQKIETKHICIISFKSNYFLYPKMTAILHFSVWNDFRN